MSKHRHKHNVAAAAAAPQAPKREFAFSRIAGATSTEYAPISTTAVVAVAASIVGGAMGLLGGWWLILPGIGLALGLLAIYYIQTSAGTLTGRQIALIAIAISLVLGAIGGYQQYRDYRQEQADRAVVRDLALRACQGIRDGDFSVMYSQLTVRNRDAVPSAHWNYGWNRLLNSTGRLEKVELSDRVVATWPYYIAMTANMHFPPGPGGEPRVYAVRLVYTRASENGTWELYKLPDFVTALPQPYPQPLVWPGTGKVTRVMLEPDGKHVVTETYDCRMAPPATQPGRKFVADLADEFLVPEPSLLRSWLPRPEQ